MQIGVRNKDAEKIPGKLNGHIYAREARDRVKFTIVNLIGTNDSIWLGDNKVT